MAVFMTAAISFVRAQPGAPATPLTLEQAVATALRNYPSLRVSQEQINAASAGIQLARTAYLPRVDGIAQVNRATRNNVFGLLLPQSVIPSISGPVIGTNNLGSVWGSAVGALVSWEPFDFGLRRANIAAASAGRGQSEAVLKRTQFEIGVQAADAYLTLLAAQETIRAAQAGVDRAEQVRKIIGAQVNAELRPGADQSRAEAELADALKDKTAGKPVTCVNLRDIRSTKTIGDRTLIYEVSSRLAYRNDPEGGCPASAAGRTLITRTPSTQLCRGDIVRVVDLTAGFDVGTCLLGDFTPYTRSR